MQFYEGKLETADKVRNREPDNVTWRNGDSYPFAFHHVEGVEETLIVNTDQGNQNSKKNQKEIEKVVCKLIFLSELRLLMSIIYRVYEKKVYS